MYNEARALVNAISEEPDDYPDQSYYRMIMDKMADVKVELAKVEKTEAEAQARKELDERRRQIIEQEWEKADLTSHIESDDIHIESDGWESEQNYFSRRYYISVDGKESTMHNFMVAFIDDSDEIESLGCSD